MSSKVEHLLTEILNELKTLNQNLAKPKRAPVAVDDSLDDAFDAYNQLAERANLPKVQARTAQRHSKLKQRLKECGGLEGWTTALEKVAASDFLSGRKTEFRADFDFLMQASRFTKLMEGGYDNHGNNQRTDNDRRRDIFESLAGVEFGGVDAGAGSAGSGDDGAPESSPERCNGSGSPGREAGVHGANGQTLQLC